EFLVVDDDDAPSGITVYDVDPRGTHLDGATSSKSQRQS
ncbi:unnamed protein product, partial [marine sediment metagenome]